MHRLWDSIAAAMVWWHAGKLSIEDSVSISHGSLHILFGFLLWLGIALLSRRPVTSWLPWAGTFIFILWNEAADVWTEQWPVHRVLYGETARDLALTMLIPTVLLFAARMRPQLFGRGTRK